MVKNLNTGRLKARVGSLVGLRPSYLTKADVSVPSAAVDELGLLRELAAIDSETLDVAGVNRAQARVAAHLDGLGFALNHFGGEARFGDLLVAERPGVRRTEWITLVTHVDTVLKNFRPFALDRDLGRAYGSGVIDNKGGVTVGLGALSRLLAARPRTELGLRFVCSPNEEMGSVGFTDRLRAFGRDTVVGLGLEPALDDGSIIHQRRGNRWYDVEVTGREAHAGRSYGAHANAAHDLAEKIRRLSRLTDYKRHLSVSVGAFSGGQDKHNIVCGVARAKLDARFASFAARDRLHRRIARILETSFERSTCGRYATRTHFAIVDDCPPFGLTKRSKRLAKIYAAEVGRVEGRTIVSKIAGGAGDVNYLSTDDNVVLDGLGPVGGEMHTVDEWLEVGSLNTRAHALARMLETLQTRRF